MAPLVLETDRRVLAHALGLRLHRLVHLRGPGAGAVAGRRLAAYVEAREAALQARVVHVEVAPLVGLHRLGGWYTGRRAGASGSTAMGEALRRGTGSNDSMPGRRNDDWALGGFAMGGGGSAAPPGSRRRSAGGAPPPRVVGGARVGVAAARPGRRRRRGRRHADAPATRRRQRGGVGAVEECRAKRRAAGAREVGRLEGVRARGHAEAAPRGAAAGRVQALGPRVRRGGRRHARGPARAALGRREGGRGGRAVVGGRRGAVGVGLSTPLRYASSDRRDRGSAAMTSGVGRRRASGTWAAYDDDATELMLAMLDVDSDLEWPRAGPPALPPVEARALLPACRTRSVRIWRWNLEPVAARESMGMSSLTWTVWACCRRLSSLEKRREQWHWNGRSPVCFLARDSPNVAGQVLAPGEAQVARRVVGAVETLRLLLAGPGAVGIDAVVVGTGVVDVGVVHVDVHGRRRLGRPVGGLGQLDGLGEGTCGQRLLAGEGGPRRGGGGVVGGHGGEVLGVRSRARAGGDGGRRGRGRRVFLDGLGDEAVVDGSEGGGHVSRSQTRASRGEADGMGSDCQGRTLSCPGRRAAKRTPCRGRSGSMDGCVSCRPAYDSGCAVAKGRLPRSAPQLLVVDAGDGRRMEMGWKMTGER
ncbi:unnamed protein product [Ilex paraguariensis]|uniref:Uncharacterized protein n=1 Tax=Ilex paraguariensis TaxID=185542 RepID=A0ABC8QSJ8_9AQUA